MRTIDVGVSLPDELVVVGESHTDMKMTPRKVVQSDALAGVYDSPVLFETLFLNSAAVSVDRTAHRKRSSTPPYAQRSTTVSIFVTKSTPYRR